MPTKDASPENGRVASKTAAEVVGAQTTERCRAALWSALREHSEVQRLLSVYLLGMFVLTPIWVITRCEQADRWLQRLSSRSRYAGNWDPWLIWVGLVGAFLVALAGYRAYFDRPETEADIEREVERLKSTR